MSQTDNRQTQACRISATAYKTTSPSCVTHEWPNASLVRGRCFGHECVIENLWWAVADAACRYCCFRFCCPGMMSARHAMQQPRGSGVMIRESQ